MPSHIATFGRTGPSSDRLFSIQAIIAAGLVA
jgi:hypothetical protein